MSVAFAPCLHCRRKPQSRPRGLCWGCHNKREVRSRYPSANPYYERPQMPNFSGPAPLPARATDARPGSPEKLQLMCERAEQGTQLFHPRDAPADLT